MFKPTKLLFLGTVAALSACSATPRVTTIQAVSESADTPYEKFLVVSLLSSFDMRRFLEKEVVLQLSKIGVSAVPSTASMDTTTPLTRKTLLALVDEVNADAVLVTQLVKLRTDATMKHMRAQATYNIRPTYYYNVWSVDLTEYTEPPALELEHELVVATQLYSVLQKEAVWGIESKSTIVQDYNKRGDYTVIVNEAKAITRSLSRDGLVAK